ncbi:uroporphyrinogen decarboxylase family protein [Rhodoblastus sphagnicola]|nr:uroporphyrinogen decarboxylase family protein [Rhodoblastus sphagnicola]
MGLDRRERFLRALARQSVDRAPVICTGGSMTATPEDVVALSGFALPEAHCDAAAMAGLALAAARITGFESVGVPLCVTVEAEAFGVKIDLGDARTEARIVQEPFASIVDVTVPSVDDLLRRSRVKVTVEAVRRLAATAGDLPIIANLIGPVSIAASVVEPTVFLRELRTRPSETAVLSAHVTDFLIAWSRQLIAAGADAIAIHEDTTTPALVGPRTFETAVFPHLQRLVAAIHEAGGRVLLHMCNALGKSAETVARLGVDAYIPDASLTAAELRESLPDVALVGNISTFLLHQGQPGPIAKLAARLSGPGGFDALSPTCGMSSITPLQNIRAMTGATTQSPEQEVANV